MDSNLSNTMGEGNQGQSTLAPGISTLETNSQVQPTATTGSSQDSGSTKSSIHRSVEPPPMQVNSTEPRSHTIEKLQQTSVTTARDCSPVKAPPTQQQFQNVSSNQNLLRTSSAPVMNRSSQLTGGNFSNMYLNPRMSNRTVMQFDNNIHDLSGIGDTVVNVVECDSPNSTGHSDSWAEASMTVSDQGSCSDSKEQGWSTNTASRSQSQPQLQESPNNVMDSSNTSATVGDDVVHKSKPALSQNIESATSATKAWERGSNNQGFRGSGTATQIRRLQTSKGVAQPGHIRSASAGVMSTSSQHGGSPKLTKKGSFRSKSSAYRGVSFNKKNNKWKSVLTVACKQHFLGYYSSEIEAAKAYDREAVKRRGKDACTNFDAVSSPARSIASHSNRDDTMSKSRNSTTAKARLRNGAKSAPRPKTVAAKLESLAAAGVGVAPGPQPLGYPMISEYGGMNAIHLGMQGMTSSYNTDAHVYSNETSNRRFDEMSIGEFRMGTSSSQLGNQDGRKLLHRSTRMERHHRSHPDLLSHRRMNNNKRQSLDFTRRIDTVSNNKGDPWARSWNVDGATENTQCSMSKERGGPGNQLTWSSQMRVPISVDEMQQDFPGSSFEPLVNDIEMEPRPWPVQRIGDSDATVGINDFSNPNSNTPMRKVKSFRRDAGGDSNKNGARRNQFEVKREHLAGNNASTQTGEMQVEQQSSWDESKLQSNEPAFMDVEDLPRPTTDYATKVPSTNIFRGDFTDTWTDPAFVDPFVGESDSMNPDQNPLSLLPTDLEQPGDGIDSPW